MKKTNQPLTQQGKEGERIYRRVSVKERNPTEERYYLVFRNNGVIPAVHFYYSDKKQWSSQTEYWLEELPLSSLIAKEKIDCNNYKKANQKQSDKILLLEAEVQKQSYEIIKLKSSLTAKEEIEKLKLQNRVFEDALKTSAEIRAELEDENEGLENRIKELKQSLAEAGGKIVELNDKIEESLPAKEVPSDKIIKELLTDYYDYMRETDDAEQRGEYKITVIDKIKKLFSGALPREESAAIEFKEKLQKCYRRIWKEMMYPITMKGKDKADDILKQEFPFLKP